MDCQSLLPQVSTPSGLSLASSHLMNRMPHMPEPRQDQVTKLQCTRSTAVVSLCLSLSKNTSVTLATLEILFDTPAPCMMWCAYDIQLQPTSCRSPWGGRAEPLRITSALLITLLWCSRFSTAQHFSCQGFYRHAMSTNYSLSPSCLCMC